MSNNYNSRRAPNVSQYLANLNHIPTPQEIAAQQNEITFDDAQLDMLANTEFFDFDQYNHFDQQQPVADPHNGARFGQFNEFNSFPGTTVTSPDGNVPSPANLHGSYPPQPHHFSASPGTGEKRKLSASAMPTTAELEEQSRLAAEEDKRRRNTAASARFRVKKKQREQALEKQAKEMSDKVASLEGKVQQLEMENKWLKELITEKSDSKTLDAALALKSEKQSEESSTEKRTDGVGTVAKTEAEEVKA